MAPLFRSQKDPNFYRQYPCNILLERRELLFSFGPTTTIIYFQNCWFYFDTGGDLKTITAIKLGKTGLKQHKKIMEYLWTDIILDLDNVHHTWSLSPHRAATSASVSSLLLAPLRSQICNTGSQIMIYFCNYSFRLLLPSHWPLVNLNDCIDSLVVFLNKSSANSVYSVHSFPSLPLLAALLFTLPFIFYLTIKNIW